MSLPALTPLLPSLPPSAQPSDRHPPLPPVAVPDDVADRDAVDLRGRARFSTPMEGPGTLSDAVRRGASGAGSAVDGAGALSPARLRAAEGIAQAMRLLEQVAVGPRLQALARLQPLVNQTLAPWIEGRSLRLVVAPDFGDSADLALALGKAATPLLMAAVTSAAQRELGTGVPMISGGASEDGGGHNMNPATESGAQRAAAHASFDFGDTAVAIATGNRSESTSSGLMDASTSSRLVDESTSSGSMDEGDATADLVTNSKIFITVEADRAIDTDRAFEAVAAGETLDNDDTALATEAGARTLTSASHGSKAGVASAPEPFRPLQHSDENSEVDIELPALVKDDAVSKFVHQTQLSRLYGFSLPAASGATQVSPAAGPDATVAAADAFAAAPPVAPDQMRAVAVSGPEARNPLVTENLPVTLTILQSLLDGPHRFPVEQLEQPQDQASGQSDLASGGGMRALQGVIQIGSHGALRFEIHSKAGQIRLGLAADPSLVRIIQPQSASLRDALSSVPGFSELRWDD